MTIEEERKTLSLEGFWLLFYVVQNKTIYADGIAFLFGGSVWKSYLKLFLSFYVFNQAKEANP